MPSFYGATDEEIGPFMPPSPKIDAGSLHKNEGPLSPIVGKTLKEVRAKSRHGSLLNGSNFGGEEKQDNLFDSRVGESPSSIARPTTTAPDNKGSPVYYLVYAAVNSIMCIPCLYGYAAVIFNNEAFSPQINALSKLVLWSSTIHQFAFAIFSSLPFSIGQVQDAGLIFLSSMANTIADEILANGGTTEEVLSTTLVLLSVATAALGVVLIVMGKFKLADVVAYLPLPVVGGYLAFIGYFCIQAGVALCISEPMIGITGWVALWDKQALILAFPGIVSGIALTWVSRNIQNDSALPLAMVAIPLVFYLVLFMFGWDLSDARDKGWVGEVSPPVPVTDLFGLIDFRLVHWRLMSKCLATWFGMVLVVSFSSCLDVAAISMDMGEALDVNKELTTVGISNFASGMTVGFTGSYIFSQTIFTARTRTNSRWVGLLVAFSFIAVVVSTVNVLEITPLFFLGSTLIFIGIDLVYEWVIEVRHKLLLSEYAVLLVTFIAIQIIGIDAGIVLGIAIAIIDYVGKTAQVSSMTRIFKRSRAVWRPEQRQLLSQSGYRAHNPKIVTLEIKGTIFFGSALSLLSSITDEIAIDASPNGGTKEPDSSPRFQRLVRANSSPSPAIAFQPNTSSLVGTPDTDQKVFSPTKPRFVVLDLSQVSNIDSSAARGCFLQLSKMCARHEIILCASGASPRVDWILRSHEAAFALDEEDNAKEKVASERRLSSLGGLDRMLLFDTLYEALEFCESKLISELEPKTSKSRSGSLVGALVPSENTRSITLATAFINLLGLDPGETERLEAFERKEEPFHDEIEYHSNQTIFERNSMADSFYVVLSGSVAIFPKQQGGSSSTNILSGAGSVPSNRLRKNNPDISCFLPPGSVFGFVDFILEHSYTFSAVAAKKRTVVARINRTGLDRLKAESSELGHIVDKVLLQASILELSNAVDP